MSLVYKKPLLISLLLVALMSSLVQAQVFRWTNAEGNTVYGDKPPESAKAKASQIELPALTIADGFGSPDVNNENTEAVTPATATDRSLNSAVSEETDARYQQFSVHYPPANGSIRARQNDLSVQLNIQPSLQAGHGVAVYLNGKQVASGQADRLTIRDISSGQHSLFVVLHDKNDNMLTNTESVNFTILP